MGCQKSATWPDLRLGCYGCVLVDQTAEDWSAAYRGAARLCGLLV
ncbi:hypothetical protein BN6_20370 [Saccharothrix espanaensis DSM 44229]|uniref:Uncharacterized protein n=1 Tax=Saccharothrix espanaensis (strain ATCC 51144 / DSM 44229 / JCM 9112 / NBRC 15066 / NRRL 15764) TaxID=1179773 RepID=K0JX66_SACES|nr:hypothetical protein BN6_20370 [Saccharothrix espanaensis DSM 44229]